MTLYLLDSTIIAFPAPKASFNVEKIDIKKAKMIVAGHDGDIIVTKKHTSKVKLLSSLLGIKIRPKNMNVTFYIGDEAIIFQVNSRFSRDKSLNLEELKNIDHQFLHLIRIK
jgi:hypothetical protein